MAEASSKQAEQLFISYTTTDGQWAKWIAWVLEEAGYRVKLMAWDFGPGSNFVTEMQRATRECERLVMVLSPAYERSPFSRAEWTAFFTKDPDGFERRLVPVRVEDYDPSGLLRARVYIDLVDVPENQARKQLLDALTDGRKKPRKAPGYPGKASAPSYPGDLSTNVTTDSGGLEALTPAPALMERVHNGVRYVPWPEEERRAHSLLAEGQPVVVFAPKQAGKT